METHSSGAIGSINRSETDRRDLALRSHAFVCGECGLRNDELLAPRVAARAGSGSSPSERVASGIADKAPEAGQSETHEAPHDVLHESSVVAVPGVAADPTPEAAADNAADVPAPLHADDGHDVPPPGWDVPGWDLVPEVDDEIERALAEVQPGDGIESLLRKLTRETGQQDARLAEDERRGEENDRIDAAELQKLSQEIGQLQNWTSSETAVGHGDGSEQAFAPQPSIMERLYATAPRSPGMQALCVSASSAASSCVSDTPCTHATSALVSLVGQGASVEAGERTMKTDSPSFSAKTTPAPVGVAPPATSSSAVVAQEGDEGVSQRAASTGVDGAERRQRGGELTALLRENARKRQDMVQAMLNQLDGGSGGQQDTPNSAAQDREPVVHAVANGAVRGRDAGGEEQVAEEGELQGAVKEEDALSPHSRLIDLVTFLVAVNILCVVFFGYRTFVS